MKKLTHLTLIQSQNLINPIEPHILENILIKINETNIYLNIYISKVFEFPEETVTCQPHQID